MHHRTLSFLTLIAASPHIVYALLFLGMIIEGDILIFSAGFLVHHNILNPLWTFGALYFGTVLGDMIWYRLGLVDPTRNRVLKFLATLADLASRRVDEHLTERTFRTLLISKYVYGAHHFLLARAGMLRVPFRKFVKNDALGSLIWILSLGSLGYLASASFSRVSHGLRFAEVALLLGIIVFILLHELTSRLLKSRI